MRRNRYFRPVLVILSFCIAVALSALALGARSAVASPAAPTVAVATGNYGSAVPVYGQKGTQRVSISGAYGLHPDNGTSLMVSDGYYFSDSFELRGALSFTGNRDGSATGVSIAPVWHFPAAGCARSNPYAGIAFGSDYWGGFDHQNFTTFGALAGYDYFVDPNWALTGELDWQQRSLPAMDTRDLTTFWFGVTDYLNPGDFTHPVKRTPFLYPGKGADELDLSGLVASAENETTINADFGRLLTDKFELGVSASYADSAAGNLSSLAIVPKYYFAVTTPIRPFAAAYAGLQDERLSGHTATAGYYGAQLGCQYLLNPNVAVDAGVNFQHQNEINTLPALDSTRLFLGLTTYWERR